MTIEAVLGIDVGTTETKVGVVALDGRLLGMGRRRYGLEVDASTGRAEQDPESWWEAVGEASREAIAEAARGTNASERTPEIVAIGLDGHGPTLVPVDATGRPVHEAITWQDTRPASIAERLRGETGIAGWGLGIIPAAAWLERADPAAAGQACWYLNTWEALGLRLTGVAGATHLPAVEASALAPAAASAAAAAGIDRDRLPEPVETGQILGDLRRDGADHLGLRAGIPVVAGLVDAHASAHGARLLEPGDGIDVGGAAGGFGLYWDRPIEARGSFTNPAPLPGRWLVGGAFAATGAALDWLRDAVLGQRWSTAELIGAGASQPAAAEGLLFLPYLAGERSPLWDPDARGAFVGLSVTHGHAAMARAVLEAAAFAIRHLLVGIEAAGAVPGVVRVCGGPARSRAWNQIKADVTGLPVEVPSVLETAVVGSAIVAAAGVGAHPSLTAAIESMARIHDRLEPDPALGQVYGRAFEAYLALHPAILSAVRP